MTPSRSGPPELPATESPFREERLTETDLFSDIARDLFLYHHGLSKKGENITMLDLPGTPQMSEPDIKKTLELILGIEEGQLENPENVRHMNYALEEGRRYLIEHLQFQESTLPKIKKIETTSDMVKLFQSTRLFQKDEKRSSRREVEIVMNCALLSAAFAAFELEKEGVRNLSSRTEYVENRFLKSPDGEASLFTQLPTQREREEEALDSKEVSISMIPGVRAHMLARSKSRLRMMGKMLRDPMASEEEALKDAIGFRIEVPREQVGATMLQIVPYLSKHFSAHDIEIEDRNMFSKGDQTFTDVELDIRRLVDANKIKEIVQKPGSNQYRVFKVSAQILVPKDSSVVNSALVYQKIEFQIVDIGNKNEAGMLNHNVYELSQTVAERTRLMGGISSAQLRKLAQQVSEKGGPDAENVIQGLIDNGDIFRLPVTGKKYASVAVWRRWIDSGVLIPPKIAKLVEARLPAKKEKKG